MQEQIRSNLQEQRATSYDLRDTHHSFVATSPPAQSSAVDRGISYLYTNSVRLILSK